MEKKIESYQKIEWKTLEKQISTPGPPASTLITIRYAIQCFSKQLDAAKLDGLLRGTLAGTVTNTIGQEILEQEKEKAFKQL